MKRCETCAVMATVRENNARQHDIPACCPWLMDNIICGDKTIDDCTEYRPVEKEATANEDR